MIDLLDNSSGFDKNSTPGKLSGRIQGIKALRAFAMKEFGITAGLKESREFIDHCITKAPKDVTIKGIKIPQYLELLDTLAMSSITIDYYQLLNELRSELRKCT